MAFTSEGEHKQEPSLLLSVLPVLFLVALLLLNVFLFGDDSTGGPHQIALLLAAAFAAALGHFVLKQDYRLMEGQAIGAIALALQAMLILLVVGALIGLWIMAGIVPTMVYYGLVLIHPAVFLPVACAACAVVSVAIGSSWSTMGTVGVALIGIGNALGLPEPMVAGAIVSGAYFGDKLSPLSETTNLAPAVAGTELFTHIRHMLYTTVPALALSLVAYGVLGLWYRPETQDLTQVREALVIIRQHFSIGVHTLATPILVFFLVMRRMPALPALLIGVLLGALQAVIFQGQSFGSGGYSALIVTAHSGFVSETGNETIDALFSKGGMLNMLPTVLLIVMAMTFGGVMEATGMLRRIASAILHLVRGAGSLVGATISACILFNLTASDQYLAIVVPGRMFREAYRRYRLPPKTLSRALEDGGTVTSVLVPWNTCGAFAASVLGVRTFSYAPWAFFNILCPLIGAFLAGMHLTLAREVEEEGASGG